MNAQTIREFKIELLDDLHELASEPVADPEPTKRIIEAFFQRLEEVNGEEAR